LFQLAKSYRPIFAEAALRLAGPRFGGTEQIARLSYISAKSLCTRLGLGLTDEFGEAFKSRSH